MSAGAWRRWSLWGATTGVSASLGRFLSLLGETAAVGGGGGRDHQGKKKESLKGRERRKRIGRNC